MRSFIRSSMVEGRRISRAPAQLCCRGWFPCFLRKEETMRVESDANRGSVVDANTVVGILNKYLRGELSAVETYRQALERLASSTCAADLLENKRSHEQRVETLRSQIIR